MLCVAPETPPEGADALQGKSVPLSKPPFWITGLLVLQPGGAVAVALGVVVDGSELVDCAGAGSSATTLIFFLNVSFWACDIRSLRLGPWGLCLGYFTPREKEGIARACTYRCRLSSSDNRYRNKKYLQMQTTRELYFHSQQNQSCYREVAR